MSLVQNPILPEAVAPGPVTLTRAELRDQVVRHLQTVELSDSADGTEGDLRAGTVPQHRRWSVVTRRRV